MYTISLLSLSTFSLYFILILSYACTLCNAELNTKMSMKGSSCMWPWFCSWWPSYVASSSATGKTEFTRVCLTSLPSLHISCLLLVCVCRVFDALFYFLLVWYFCTLAIRDNILISNGSRSETVRWNFKSLFRFEDVTLLHSHEKRLINGGFNKLLQGPTLACAISKTLYMLLIDLYRIKDWWVFHHYISIFLFGVMLTWWVISDY